MHGDENMDFSLAWYDKESDTFVGEMLLPVDANEVRRIFNLSPDEYPGDCLKVEREHVNWLFALTHNQINLDKFDYFVEVSNNDLKTDIVKTISMIILLIILGITFICLFAR